MQNFDVLDDALYLINKQIIAKGASSNNVKAVKGPTKTTAGEQAQWEREEDLIRKKLERNAVNMMKNKIAQQNKASNEQASGQPEQAPQGDQGGMAGQNALGNQVQLSQNQIEEAKQLTAGKMKVFRKDRLFASDREKTENLMECLKNVRITDETAYF